MQKCLVIPDSFKGTLRAVEVCEIMQTSIKKHFPECQVLAVPVADGGEGTVDCFLNSTDAKKVTSDTTGPFREPIKASYAIMGDTAILEMASVAGLSLAENRLNPCKTTTYGLGTLIRHAVMSGSRKIVIGLGGSCTNDGGIGMAEALGTKFYNQQGEKFSPNADEMTMISRIDTRETEKLLEECKIIGMCDIDNSMHGSTGAAYIFAPQKGADADMVQLLDKNLVALAEVIKKSLGKEVAEIPGAGAAGALGAGIVAFLNGKLNSGIDTILDLIDYETMLEGTDLVFTGEGRIDQQSLRGKVVSGVARRAKVKSVPVVAVVGSVGNGAEGTYEMGVNAIFSINRQPVDFEISRYMSIENMSATMDNLMRYYKLAMGK